MYLGVPLTTKHHTRLFKYLLDRANTKLAGWKMQNLSRAARLLLIKSTLTALPMYTMQSVALPNSILTGLERSCRNFFWGVQMGHRGLYTVT